MRPPTAVLLQVLRERRDAGDAFGDAWPDAVHAALVDVQDLYERRRWRHALQGTISAWQASYEQQPAGRRERHLSILANNDDREPIVATRTCAHCDGPVPPHPKGLQTKRYCTRACKDRADYQRRADVKNERRRQRRELARAA
jgi:hypothetical protein